MANRIKSTKSKAPNPEKLTSDKAEKVDMKKLVKDERTHKILGSVLLLISFFLFIAFTSYLFTWAEDQDKVKQSFSKIFFSGEIKTVNLLGNIGAYISHLFFLNGFGLASYLFCTFFFIVGVNLLFKRKIFSIWRNFRYVIVGLLFFSTALAFVTKGLEFPYGGEVGNMVSSWLIGLIGRLGTAAVLLIAGFAYFIWRFNPVFKLPARKPKVADNDETEKFVPVDNSFTDEARLFVEDSLEADPKGNTLRQEGGVPLRQEKTNREPSDGGMKLIEKNDEKNKAAKDNVELIPTIALNENIIPNTKGNSKKQKPVEDLELELNPIEEDDEPDLDSNELGKSWNKPEVVTPYDPILDLRDYKYPSLDLLETHGSEKIIQDPAELEANKNQIINTLKNYDIAIQKISA
ncbi:MAG: cell division protein FtsK, partial [Bacteroidetes bacterium]